MTHSDLDAKWLASRQISRASHIYFGMVAHKDGPSGTDVQSFQCSVKDLGIWFADAFGIGIRIVSKMGARARHCSLRLCMRMDPFVDQAELQARCAKDRQRLEGVRKQHAGIRKCGAVVVQQGLSHARRIPNRAITLVNSDFVERTSRDRAR